MTQTDSFHETLTEIHRRPAPFETYTAEVLWDDEHISQNMLRFHLDGESELASRPHAFIDQAADWIADRFSLAAGRRVADFGCGPGLYATRFAATGAEVTGIDVSRRSIAHAASEARKLGLDIDFVQGNYLDYRPEGVFDLITLIYCDLCALSPDQRRRLLTMFHDLLADGGCVLLDVFTLRAFDGREETTEHGHRLMDGFWAPGDYWGFKDTFKYDDEKVVLDKYTVVEPHRQRCVYNWLQYYSFESLSEEFERCGLRIVERFADLTGAPHQDGDMMTVVAQKL